MMSPDLMDMYIHQTNELKDMYSSDPHILADLERMEEGNIKRVPSEYAEANYAKNKQPMPRLIEMFNCMRENAQCQFVTKRTVLSLTQVQH